jgi:hypothetical protein
MMCVSKKPRILQMHTTVLESYSDTVGGSIICTPIGNEPITYEWMDENNNIINEYDNKNEIHNVKPGNYFVIATDSNGDVAKVALRVTQSILPTVSNYNVTNTSSQTAWDGSVAATISPPTLHDVKYLWSNGSLTHEPVLKDVPNGSYALCIISTKHDSPIAFVHAANPGQVKTASQ